MTRILVPKKIGSGNRYVTCRKNNIGEYVCRLWVDGKHYAPADYYTSDAQDASQTMQAMYYQGLKKNPANDFIKDVRKAKMRKNPNARMTTKRLQAILANVKKTHPESDFGLDFSYGGVTLTNASGSRDVSHRMSKAAMGDLLYTMIQMDHIKGNPMKRISAFSRASKRGKKRIRRTRGVLRIRRKTGFSQELLNKQHPNRRMRKNPTIHRKLFHLFVKVGNEWKSLGKPVASKPAAISSARSANRRLCAPVKIMVG